MAFQPLADGAKVVLLWGETLETWSNTMYFTRPSYTLAEQQVLVDLVMDQFEGLADIYLQSGFQLKDAVCYDMRSETAPIVNTLRPPYSGSQVGNPGAINSGAVVTFYTAQRGRSGRGRNYLAGFSEDDMGRTAINNQTMLAAIETFYNTIIADYPTNGWSWVVASGQQGGVTLPALVPYPVTSVVIRNAEFGTQRRRINRP